MYENMSALQKHFHRMLQNMSGSESSVQHQQLTLAPRKMNTVTSDSAVKLHFQSKTVTALWTGVEKGPLLSNPAEPLG